ncbi:TetR family transcriptional regulator [Mycobacterium kansasii]|uniref:Fatty acid metabolism regulator protein n=1 Tax=Mycobacterium innocens TaxID=2341083 RepID=A0A498Q0N1_9MYCO|nr:MULTISPECIES: TetR/AcrR family transcriptional regulator [Mycobacterium]KZS59851.1 TetR family transcriptional regulator [Mycobacterium kansasii]KZS78417.1 TetR family transcriptional regulator [Mycobacterium kansasii]VBA38861.1 Fatty acid metabolism regulator protein [Mycobacterium innocens]
MSTTRRRRAVSDEDKSQRRDQIMAAAKEVFARNGFHATTIADIAKQAGLAYGLIYWYFESKDDLFHSLMAAEEDALRAHLAEAMVAAGGSADSTGGETLFRAGVQATFEFFEADKATVKLLFRDAHALGDRFEKHLGGIYERFIDDIETVIVAAQERGDVVAAPPRMVAYTLAALVGQLAHRRLSTDDGVTAAQVADFVVSLVLDGLRPRRVPDGRIAPIDSYPSHRRRL